MAASLFSTVIIGGVLFSGYLSGCANHGKDSAPDIEGLCVDGAMPSIAVTWTEADETGNYINGFCGDTGSEYINGVWTATYDFEPCCDQYWGESSHFIAVVQPDEGVLCSCPTAMLRRRELQTSCS